MSHSVFFYQIMTNFFDVPRDLIISFLAKIPIIHYSTISLTSKEIGNLLSSPELFNARSQEMIAYVCLEDHNGHPKWFTLSKKPLVTTLSTGFWLTPVRMEVSYRGSESMASTGRKLYMLQTENPEDIALRLRIFDCLSKEWSLTAPMVNARNNTAVLLGIEDNIWVIGGTKDPRRLSPEVYSTKKGLWSSVTEPIIENDASIVLINGNDEDRVEIWQKFGAQAHRLTFIPEISSWEKGDSCLSNSFQKSFTVAMKMISSFIVFLCLHS